LLLLNKSGCKKGLGFSQDIIKMIVQFSTKRCLRMLSRSFATQVPVNVASSTVVIDNTSAKNVRIVTLNRPERRNSLNLEMIERLEMELDDISRDESIRCLVLQARVTEPNPVFSSGHDLKELSTLQADEHRVRTVFESCSRMMLKLAELPIPTISIVEGIATAAGLQLALSCDMVYCHANAKFATPGECFTMLYVLQFIWLTCLWLVE
jgi:1,4-dihydroxy-2-naphthoyl-CoA synthase